MVLATINCAIATGRLEDKKGRGGRESNDDPAIGVRMKRPPMG